ncbi:MAG: neuraminidase-like domain-containing protein [Thermodesulfobacteriota bacterium]|nr:neuraminidase-like domain-containing protein [Thermodesulfobacteriota bacterium]
MKLLNGSFDSRKSKDVKKLQDILVYLGGKINETSDDRMSHRLGDTTAMALKDVKKRMSLPANDRINKTTIEALNQGVIEKRFATKSQTANLHRLLTRAARIADLDIDLTEDRNSRQQGEATSRALRAFQKKYHLKQTGRLNRETLERLESVSASRVAPVKKLKVPQTERLMKVRYPIRLNMQKAKVRDLQRALSWLGYGIGRKEAAVPLYGKTTRKAVMAFQAEHELPVSGNVGFKTAHKINALIEANSRMVSCKDKYRVRGTVRNETWDGIKLATVQVFEKQMRADIMLAERKTLGNGFFDVQYAPPVNPLTGQPRETFQLRIRVTGPDKTVLGEKTFHVTGKVLWANFTQGDAPYKGKADFQVLEKVLTKTLGPETPIAAIEESGTHRDVTYLRKDTGLAGEDIMKMTLARRIADAVDRPYLTAEVFYAFIRQNQPSTIPGNLMPDYPEEWDEWIAMLVERCADCIPLLEEDLKADMLDNALRQNMVSRQVARDRDHILEALEALKVDRVMEKPMVDGKGSLKTLLETSNVPAGRHTAVGACFARCRGFTPSFWGSVSKISGISNAMVEDFKTTAALGRMTGTFDSMILFLKTGLQNGAYAAVSSFAALSEDDWLSTIAENGNKIPSWVDGKGAKQKRRAYASWLRQNAEALFPAVSLVARVGRSSAHALGNIDGIRAAIEAKPDFDLKRDPCAHLFADTGAGLSAHEKAATKVLQRVHRIAPTAETGRQLLEGGYYSAAQVYRAGRTPFVNAMARRGMAKADAEQVFDSSAHQYAVVLTALGKFYQDFYLMDPALILSRAYKSGDLEELTKEIPDLETLFGPIDIREVRHCESVLGPSAYLTDLFRFLNEKEARTGGKTVKDVLFERRPDLGHIKLNCTNTNTPLPYIDLVCEILENRVMEGDGVLDFQCTWPAADLLAEPQHVNADAYERLKLADFPLFCHFNLWQEETRIYLAHLGIPRHHLMKTFLLPTGSAAEQTADACSIAAEYFGIADQEQQVIITPRATNYWQKRYWSNDILGANVPVDRLLQKSGLTYHQLLELLQCAFINSQSPESTVLCPIDDCDLGNQTVDNMSLPRLDRMNRFLRLWRRTGLELWALDYLISHPAVGDGNLDDNCLINLKQFEVLRGELDLEVEELAAFFGPINTACRPAATRSGEYEKPLFEKLFLSGAMDAGLYDDFLQLMTTPASGSDVSPYLDHAATALSSEREALERLLPLTDGYFTVDTLSLFFRYVTLARTLKWKVTDLFRYCDLAGIADPFDAFATVARIVREKQQLRDAGASMVQLEYLLTHAQESPAGWRQEVYAQRLQGLREALVGIQDKVITAEQAGEDSLRVLLAMVGSFADTGILETAMTVIAGTWTASHAEIIEFIKTRFGVFVDNTADAVDTLKYTAPATPAALAIRRAYVMAELFNYLNRTTVKAFIADTFALESSQAQVLLDSLHLPSEARHLLSVFQDEELFERDADNEYVCELTPENLPDSFAALYLLHKAAMACTCLDCNTDELAWLVANPAAGDTMDFNALPIKEGAAAVSLDRWVRTWRFLAFKRRFPEPEHASFFDVLALAASPSSSAEAINDALCAVTGWDPADQERLHYSALDYRCPDTYEWFAECHHQKKITASDFQALFMLARRDPDGEEQEKARMARNMAQAKYSRERWLEILKPMMDDLREQKRTALTAYLVERSQRERAESSPEYWISTDDLYGWFLIDVEMCADQLTSRIKQAILSTQLFVQRCLLNLENREVEVAQPDPDVENNWDQWKWMKNYRIWEANRKVFLFPENWIEPELRDTKSPFFEELESDILSSEITNANVEASLQRYIQKLEEVSRLEICSIFHEREAGINRLHVAARTRSMPAIFYYRYYDLVYSRWSPWEKIENDIQSDHVVPWVYNRKLHLFWLVFHEKPVKLKKLPPVKQSETPVQNSEPAKMFEIELAWCVRQPDGWDARRISKKKLIHPWERPTFSYNLKPRYKRRDNSLYLDIYISTSKSFNNGLFYDQFIHDKVRLTEVRYDQTLRPWHSSSFVFTGGGVRDVLLRGIPGYYFDPDFGEKTNMTSYEYIKKNFDEAGAEIYPLTVISEQLALPAGMHYSYTRMANNQDQEINEEKLNVFGPDKGTRTLLYGADSPFEAVLCQQGLSPVDGKIRPLLYQDRQRAFFFLQVREESFWNYFFNADDGIYQARPFYHPWAEVFQQEINRDGVAGLFRRRLQLYPGHYSNRSAFSFAGQYAPAWGVNGEAAETEALDFSRNGACAIYNWELFFHAPLMIACRLSQNQRFEEAMQWFHYIFDPTSTDYYPSPQRFWITKPFHETSAAEYRIQRIKNIIENIDDFKAKLVEWRNHPFKPHLIAEHRTVAYQRTVVMKYLDNLIAWGDQLFRQDTMESINEATLLYILAHEILGARPVIVPAIARDEKTFNELVAEEGLDTFGNTRVEVGAENVLGLPIEYTLSGSSVEPMPDLEISYFGLPHNDKLLSYWDTVEDRLFKIRHGLNIEGLKRQLPLFEPPIDPGMLVKAAAAGLDLATVLNDLNAPAPAYRFSVLSKKAVEFCNDVKRLGDRLLSALEKKDAEELAVLRSANAVTVLENMREIKELRIEAARYAIESLRRQQDICQIRIDHIESLDEQLDAEEKAGDWGTAAAVLKGLSKVSKVGAMIASAFPDASVGANGAGGTPEATAKSGGSNVEKGFKYAGKGFDAAAELCKWMQDDLKSEAKSERTKAERASKIAEEEKAIAGLDNKILEGEILVQMAEKDLENFETQLAIKQGEHAYLQEKYTNAQLYQWMITQISTVYFQAYQLAYDMAKRAEKSYRRELGVTDTGFIQFGHWDSLKKGLLSADRLIHDIRRMEATYLDQHKRELELTKHVSLARLAPDKLLELIMTGRCSLDLAEWMYNLDYPGHYRRRIKSVAVTIQCEADPFTNLNCGLSLGSNEIRVSNLVGSGYARENGEDPRFLVQQGFGESIATSHGEWDNGLFRLNFEDQRFLPFEGAGAAGTWDIHMPREHNAFDYTTLTDVILHIHYTARNGGESLATAAKGQLDDVLSGGGTLLMGLKQCFPETWETFLTPESLGAPQVFTCEILPGHYPFLARMGGIELSGMGMVVSGRHTGKYAARVSIPGQPDIDCDLTVDPALNNVHSNPTVFDGTAPGTGTFSIMVRRDTAAPDDFSSLPLDDLEDVYLLFRYK